MNPVQKPENYLFHYRSRKITCSITEAGKLLARSKRAEYGKSYSPVTEAEKSLVPLQKAENYLSGVEAGISLVLLQKSENP